jgi:hypothetical protein
MDSSRPAAHVFDSHGRTVLCKLVFIVVRCNRFPSHIAFRAGTDLMELICNGNERSDAHLVGKR